MKTFLELYQDLQEDAHFERLALNPNAQFGSEDQPLLGARYLPERLVAENSFEETDVRYRTKPALDGTRYSPAQMQKSDALIGTVKVDLGNTDVADQFTGQDHDGLIKLLNRGGDAEAIAQLTRWSDRSLLRPHTLKNEIQRWQAWCLGRVERRGSNGYSETVNYYTPPGHRVVIEGGTLANPQGWYNNNYDPLDDIVAAFEKLEGLGYAVQDMISTGTPIKLLRRNGQVAKRSSSVVIDVNGSITSMNSRITNAQLNQVLQDEDLVPITRYNAGYETANGFKRFMDIAPNNDRDYLVIFGRTQRQWDMATDYAGAIESLSGQFVDGAITLESTLGYYAVGRNVSQSAPGRTLTIEQQTRKPQGLYGESYQTGFPVICDPQSYVVLEIKRPT
jgi:hypothetical protein